MLSYLDQNKEWIFQGVGVTLLVGAVIFVRDFVTKFKPFDSETHRFIGCYEAYYPRASNEGLVTRGAIQVSRSIFKGYNVEFLSGKHRLEGELQLTGSNIYLHFHGKSFDGQMLFILREPLGSFDVLYGVLSGISRRRRPIVSRVCLKKVPEKDLSIIQGEMLEEKDVPKDIWVYLLNSNAPFILGQDQQ